MAKNLYLSLRLPTLLTSATLTIEVSCARNVSRSNASCRSLKPSKNNQVQKLTQAQIKILLRNLLLTIAQSTILRGKSKIAVA